MGASGIVGAVAGGLLGATGAGMAGEDKTFQLEGTLYSERQEALNYLSKKARIRDFQ